MDKSLIALITGIVLFTTDLVVGQTHTMPGSNVVPSGASLTISSGATITAAGGSTVTGLQPSDADLTSWAAITRASGIDTFVTTPSSANLRSAVTDENGTGALLFSGATSPDFTTGFTIGAAAASGKVVIGDGTKYAGSSYTEAAPGTSGNVMTSNGTNWTSAVPAAAPVYSSASPPTTDVGMFTIVKTGVDLKTNATTDLFTVPTSRAFVCTSAYLVPTSVTGGAAVAIAWNIQESGASGAMTTSAAAASLAPVTTRMWSQFSQLGAAGAGGSFPTCAAANKVQLKGTTMWTTSTTVTGNVFVCGFYSQ